jgi:murein DD-endopeptidase MepM/ murein hydrolase activator NlpD
MFIQKSSSRVSVMATVLLVVAGVFAVPRASAHESDPHIELVFPQEPQVTEFHDSFGALRSGGRPHQGNDLMAPKMTQVYAAADGIIETLGDSPRAGRYIVIAHAGGWSTTYAHLNNDTPGTDDGRAPWVLTVTHAVVEGQYVQGGELIGWVGDSGNAEGTGSHVHFELALDQTPTDPHDLLQEAWDRAFELYLLDTRYKLPKESFPIT